MAVRKLTLLLFTVAVLLSALHYHVLESSTTVELNNLHDHHRLSLADACELIHRFQNSITGFGAAHQIALFYSYSQAASFYRAILPPRYLTLELSARPPPSA